MLLKAKNLKTVRLSLQHMKTGAKQRYPGELLSRLLSSFKLRTKISDLNERKKKKRKFNAFIVENPRIFLKPGFIIFCSNFLG